MFLWGSMPFLMSIQPKVSEETQRQALINKTLKDKNNTWQTSDYAVAAIFLLQHNKYNIHPSMCPCIPYNLSIATRSALVS